MTFYRLHFSRPFRTALERHFFALSSEKPPKIEPKPSQNPVENVSKIDLMLRRLKSESEQTLPHFCSFLPLQAARKSSQNRLRNRFSLRCSQKLYKNRCFPHFQPSWPPNWLQDGRPKLAQNRPKTVKIDYRSVKALMTPQNNPRTPKKLKNLSEKNETWRKFRRNSNADPARNPPPSNTIYDGIGSDRAGNWVELSEEPWRVQSDGTKHVLVISAVEEIRRTYRGHLKEI